MLPCFGNQERARDGTAHKENNRVSSQIYRGSGGPGFVVGRARVRSDEQVDHANAEGIHDAHVERKNG
jgi:hypothetical protein